MDIEYEKQLDNEYKNIIDKYWKCLNNTYKSKAKKQYHRTKIKPFPNIQKIKEKIHENIGTIGVFIFLTDFCSKIKIPGPYRNIEK